MSAQGVDIGPGSVRDGIERATATVIDSVFAALRARNADQLTHLWASGPTVLHVSGTQIIQIDTIAPYTARGLSELERFEATWTPHTLQVPSADLAIGTVRVRFRMTPRGQQPQPTSGVWTLILKRFPAGWRIIGDHRTMAPE